MEILELITDIIIWYQELDSDYQGINELMHNRQRLTAYQVTLANEVGKARKEWKTALWQLEKKKMKMRFQALEQGVSKADTISRVNTSELLKDAYDRECIYKGLDDRYKAHSEVLSSMSQQIAYLRNELEKNKF